jgi:adenylate cyclase
LAAAEKALSLDSSLAEAHATKGRALSEIGRLDEALIAHEESFRLEPDSYVVRMNFAHTCVLLGRNDEAVIHYERAAQLVETDYLSVSMAAWCYFELGRKNDQTAALRRALEREEREIALRPDNGHALALGACELAELGEHERAKEWASRSLTIDPDDIVSRYNITCAMARMNELDRALDLLEAYARDMPLPRINRIKQDGSLQSLRGHPRFQALVAQAEARWAAAQRAAGSI